MNPRLRYRRLAALLAGSVCVLLCATIFRVPFPVGDTLAQMLVLQETSTAELWHQTVSERGFMRPMRWMTAKILFDAASGTRFGVFKSFHAAELVIIVMLAIRLLRVRSRRDLTLIPATLAMLLGLHTFTGIVNEIYPINAKATVLACLVGVVALADAAPGRGRSLLALALAAYALLVNELGMLVPFAIVATALLRFRGARRNAAAAAVALIAAYLTARFALLEIGTPGLSERASGFGMTVREPAELEVLFASNPLVFYAYNVVSSFLTVVLSEPRGGVFEFARALSSDGLRAWHAIVAITSGASSALIIRFAWLRRHAWRRWALRHDDRIVLLGAALLCANSAISFPYAKDVVMGPAGVFYTLATYMSARHWLRTRAGTRKFALGAGALASALVVCFWSIRAFGLAYELRTAAYTNRADWASVDSFIEQQDLATESPAARELVYAMRRHALAIQTPTPYESQRWARLWLEPR